ncbi:MAG TPA: molybdopterin cofactor-binding domain-containing protein [Ktedonosporobacter sp.]|nr:molybdopterin cofactor-binding domain-containing protein [Ktedonosporobacter sp.]
MELELRINGVVASLDTAPNESLLTLLRREGHCSVKQGCETGECGACTVLVDGVPRPSCVMLAAQAGGCTVTTAESLGSSHNLHPLQRAFVDVGAVQCGFCTPGMLLSASALLNSNPSPTEDEVRDALSGNLCRCSGYLKPVQAVMRAAAILRGETVPEPTYHISKTATAGANDRHQALPRTAETTNTNGKARPAGKEAVTTKIPAITLDNGANLSASGALAIIGQPVPNINATKLVTGKGAFAADYNPPGMLYGRILTSPHAHAIIRHIDVTQARALPGVHSVLTYKDAARIPYSSVERPLLTNDLKDQYILDYTMRYVGDRVAVVAAETPEIAEQALSLIEVQYELLPAILDPRQALEAGTPPIHTDGESQGIYDAPRNIAARIHQETGDLERGFAESDLIVEGEYFLPLTQPAPIEPHTVISYFDEDDYLVVRTGTQAPHHIRRVLSRILQLPARRIRVVQPASGGGFGIKEEVVLEDLCSLLTIATNRPIMLSYSRAEEFRSGRVSQQHILRMKTGVKRDGTLVANQMILLASTGAYGTHPLIGRATSTSNNTTLSGALALYPCLNLRFIAEVLYTNQQPSGSFQGYESTQEFFALESHMDEIARQLQMDSLELRRKNWIKTGDAYPLLKTSSSTTGNPALASCGLPECLKIVEEQLNWQEQREKSGRLRRGVGVALSLQGIPTTNTQLGAETSGAIIKLNEDGSFDIFANANGEESDTLLAQIAAEVLGVPLADILLHTSSTSTSPLGIGHGPSSTIYGSGNAIKKAAEQMQRQIFTIAGRLLQTLPETLKISAGTITAPNGQTVTMPQLATYALHIEGRHIMTTASWKVQTPTTFAALGVEVEADTESGNVRILKVITALDAGKIINPQIAEGQILSRIVQGLGTGISEEVIYDRQGNVLTATFSDYGVYTARDMPEIQIHLVETSDPVGPFGAKAIGNLPLSSLAPAIANAVANALGTRLRQIPLTPERVLRATHAQAQTQAQAQVAK